MSTHFEAPVVNMLNDEKKDEKIAAAKQRLKQFKKESKNHSNKKLIEEDNLQNHQLVDPDLSGRSSPASSVHSFNTSQKQYSNNHSPNKPQQMQSFTLPPSSDNYKDQQLQLHLQTIGILVAEKAELQSKLQQTVRKCDKKQEECDELTGRLKASRQKITDLEKLVQQMNQTTQLSTNENETINGNYNNDYDHSNYLLIIDELRIRLSETNDKLVQKQIELNDLFQLNTDLTTQLELLNMKLAQFGSNNKTNNNDSNDETIEKLKQELEESETHSSNLQMKIQTLQATVHDYEFKLKQQHDKLKQDYQQYVDQFKGQIENLVDQINRLTDEREASFSKIDKLELLLKETKINNDSLELKLKEANQKIEQQQLELNTTTSKTNSSSSKENLLENEIKYFKQQIELLVKENNDSIELLNEKERTVSRLEKELKTYETDRENQVKLIEQVHNDKQALSRALQQNKELKDQLAELQDAFVNVTKQNLDLATQLETEKFKINNSSVETQKETVNQTDDWDESDESDQAGNNDSSNTSLMNGIKERLNELEKENKDLNDYITLMDENLKQNNDQQLSVINSQLIEIESLNKTISEIKEEKIKLKQQLDVYLLNKNTDNNNNTNNLLEFNETNFKNLLLLEKRFKNVMLENADLREKIQELEHVISQLQFETETISDYINKYQIEREKLNKKYSLKDETIRSLSTQLQVNKLALHELNNYFTAYMRVSYNSQSSTTLEEENELNKKRTFILMQAQSLLNELTRTTSITLQNSMSSNTSSLSNSIKNIDTIKSISNLSISSKEEEETIDSKSIQAFKSIVTVCPSCHGDLFVV